MASANADALVRLDLNNPVFQTILLGLQKPERHAALDTLNKINQLTWNQLYRDGGLKWEKISNIKSPPDIDQSNPFASPNPGGPRLTGTATSSAC